MKQMTRPFRRHLARRDPAQFAVDERRQGVERLFVALAPGQEQSRDVWRCRHSGSVFRLELSKPATWYSQEADLVE
jgi:hypothetical protein